MTNSACSPMFSMLSSREIPPDVRSSEAMEVEEKKDETKEDQKADSDSSDEQPKKKDTADSSLLSVAKG